MKRRQFFKTAVAVTPMLASFSPSLSAIIRFNNSTLIEKRSLGRTGEYLSMIGFGGIVVKNASPSEASKRVDEAIACGINYFDVAPSYGDAEVKLGSALEPYRSQVFLACKTGEREKEGARKELEQSLDHLRTDHFDLYQFHAVKSLDDVDKIFSSNGAIHTLLEAREEGKIRFIGFSAHSVEAAMALMDRFDFDTILFPVNFASWHAGNFGPQVLARAEEKQMGILALKAMAKGPWPEGANRDVYPKCWYEPLTEPDESEMGLRFTLSHAVTAAIPPGDENLFRKTLDLAKKFKPLQPEEIELIKKKGIAGTPLFRFPQD